MAPALRDPAICKRCFWVFPEDYKHIALQQIRRTDIAWQDEDVVVHERLDRIGAAQGLTLADFLRQRARAEASES